MSFLPYDRIVVDINTLSIDPSIEIERQRLKFQCSVNVLDRTNTRGRILAVINVVYFHKTSSGLTCLLIVLILVLC